MQYGNIFRQKLIYRSHLQKKITKPLYDWW